MKKLIPFAVMALAAGCSSAPKDVYLSCMPEKVKITTVGGVDPGKEQGDPKDYDFLLRFNIDEQTANEGSDIYTIDESENELRFDLKNPEDDGSNYIFVNRKDLSYARRRMFGEIYKDGYTMFFDDNGSCEKVDKPSSPDNQI